MQPLTNARDLLKVPPQSRAHKRQLSIAAAAGHLVAKKAGLVFLLGLSLIIAVGVALAAGRAGQGPLGRLLLQAHALLLGLNGAEVALGKWLALVAEVAVRPNLTLADEALGQNSVQQALEVIAAGALAPTLVDRLLQAPSRWRTRGLSLGLQRLHGAGLKRISHCRHVLVAGPGCSLCGARLASPTLSVNGWGWRPQVKLGHDFFDRLAVEARPVPECAVRLSLLDTVQRLATWNVKANRYRFVSEFLSVDNRTEPKLSQFLNKNCNKKQR